MKRTYTLLFGLLLICGVLTNCSGLTQCSETSTNQVSKQGIVDRAAVIRFSDGCYKQSQLKLVNEPAVYINCASRDAMAMVRDGDSVIITFLDCNNNKTYEQSEKILSYFNYTLNK